MRTTSSVEAVNSVIQRSFPKRTNIFKFIENLKLFDSSKSTDLYQLAQGDITSQKLERKRAEDKRRENHIKVCSDKLKNEDISVAEFLKLVSEEAHFPAVGAYIVSMHRENMTSKALYIFIANQGSRKALNKVSDKSKTLKKKDKRRNH